MRYAILLAGLFLIYGCSQSPVSTGYENGPAMLSEISDGTHGNEGNDHFFFLPPLIKKPLVNGVFDEGLNPVVEVRELMATPLGEIVDMDVPPVFTTEGTNRVKICLEKEMYYVIWHTKKTCLKVKKNYRIRILVENTILGFCDVDVYKKGKKQKRIDRDNYFALKKGRTLPIKFRIEEGALGTLDDGLVAYYPADGDAVDAVGGYNGTLLGNATYVDGVVGSAFSFDGQSGVQIPFNENIDFSATDAFSYCLWINVAALDSSYHIGQGLIVKGNVGWNWGAFIRPSGQLLVGASSSNSSTTNYTVPLNEWVHVTVTFDAGTFAVFANGVATPLRFDELTITESEYGMTLGCHYWFGPVYNNYFTGELDDVRVYNRVLTEGEIAQLATAPQS